MKQFFSSLTTRVVLISLVLGAASGVFATAITNSYLSDYALQLGELTRPLRLEEQRPKAFPNSYAEATNRFVESTLPSVVSVFSQSSKTNFGFAQEARLATGVVVTSDGWVVIPSASFSPNDKLVVQTKDQIYDVTRIVTDPLTQVVFLKTSGTNLPVTGFGSGFGLSPGDQLFLTSGTAQLIQASVAGVLWQPGVILSSDIPSRRALLFTESNIVNAPAFDLTGAFVGFASKKDSQLTLLPFEAIQPAMNALLEKKEISHPSLGVQYIDLAHTIGMAESLKRGHQGGAYLTGRPTVKKGSAAANSGLLEGDIVTAVNGQDVDETKELSEWLLSFHVGDRVSLTIDRSGEKKLIDVVLGEYAK